MLFRYMKSSDFGIFDESWLDALPDTMKGEHLLPTMEQLPISEELVKNFYASLGMVPAGMSDERVKRREENHEDEKKDEE